MRKHVDEVMGDPQAWHGKRLQLHGFVMDPVYHKADTLEYSSKSRATGRLSRPPTRVSCQTPEARLGGRAEGPARSGRVQRRPQMG